jgi:hypothetical protein
VIDGGNLVPTDAQCVVAPANIDALMVRWLIVTAIFVVSYMAMNMTP